MYSPLEIILIFVGAIFLIFTPIAALIAITATILTPVPPLVKEALAYKRVLAKAFGLRAKVRFISPEGKVRIHVASKATLPEKNEIAMALQREVEIEHDYRGRAAIIVQPSTRSLLSEAHSK